MNNYIEQFSNWTKKYSGPIPMSLRIHGTDSSFPHIYFSACVHGNEVGSLPAFMEFINNIVSKKQKYPGTLTFSLGNIEAMKANVRFVNVDMNRHFGDIDSRETEAQRANELCQLINECDIFIDFHQTIEPTTEPFFVISDTPQNRDWAQSLKVANKAILRNPKVDTYLTATSYAYKKGKVAATIELSQKGFSESTTELCHKVINRTLELSYKIQSGSKLQDISKNSPALTWLIMAHYEKFDGPLCKLLPGWTNLSPIKKGQAFGFNQSGMEMLSPIDGFTLFPKYVERNERGEALGSLPKDILTITKII